MLKYYNEIDNVNSRQIYPSFSEQKETENYIIPNCYYINSKGLLYNCFGNDDHKGTNLLYTYKLIKDYYFYEEYNEEYEGGEDPIACYKYNSKPSLERKLIEELDTYKRIIKTNKLTRVDLMKYFNLNFCYLKDPLIIKYVIGIISSKIILLNKFIELEKNSENKRDDIEKIIDLSKDDLKDILVRYCGFHKIETLVEKIITTSSLDLNSFINYLDNGWIIDIVPKISLYEKEDILYKTLVVDNFLNKNPQYSDRIKVKK